MPGGNYKDRIGEYRLASKVAYASNGCSFGMMHFWAFLHQHVYHYEPDQVHFFLSFPVPLGKVLVPKPTGGLINIHALPYLLRGWTFVSSAALSISRLSGWIETF
jgi:hypothetical protein